jgi:hypothetical protein
MLTLMSVWEVNDSADLGLNYGICNRLLERTRGYYLYTIKPCPLVQPLNLDTSSYETGAVWLRHTGEFKRTEIQGEEDEVGT